jgi:hypothetical protein
VNRFTQITFVGIFALASQTALCQSGGNVDDDLRHSQICAKAASEFRKQPEWSNASEPQTFTSHFNKAQGICLVMVSSSSLVSGGVLETHHVYNALEGTVLGGEIIVKDMLQNGEQKTRSIMMVRAGKTVKKNEAAEAYHWFEGLMSQ